MTHSEVIELVKKVRNGINPRKGDLQTPSKGVKIVILAVVKEKKFEDEEFGEYISRIREKYAERIGTENIILKAV